MERNLRAEEMRKETCGCFHQGKGHSLQGGKVLHSVMSTIVVTAVEGEAVPESKFQSGESMESRSRGIRMQVGRGFGAGEASGIIKWEV